jgi:hypothetical protein
MKVHKNKDLRAFTKPKDAIVIPCRYYHGDTKVFGGLIVDLLINDPIITVEIHTPVKDTESGTRLVSYGMCYCRPSDDWDPVHYSFLAFEKALNRIPVMKKSKEVWDDFKLTLIEDVKNKPYKIIDMDLSQEEKETFERLAIKMANRILELKNE